MIARQQAMVGRSTHARAVVGLLLANLMWGLSFPLVKALAHAHQQALPGSGTWFVTAGAVGPRFLLAALVLAAMMGRSLLTVTRSELMQGTSLGIAAAGGMILQGDGLQFTTASVSAFLTQFYAILIPVWVAFRSGRAPARRVWISCALVLAGAAVLARFDPRSMRLGRGEAETLLCSLFFMAQILILAQPRFAANRVMPITLVMFAVESVVFVALAFVTAPRFGDLFAPWRSAPWIGCTLALAVLSTLVSYLLMNRWQRHLSESEAAVIYCIEPLFASGFALFLPGLLSRWSGFNYPNEQLNWELLVGGGLITGANVLIQINPGTREDNPAPPPSG